MMKYNFKRILTIMTLILFVTPNIAAFADNIKVNKVDEVKTNEKYEEVRFGDSKILGFNYSSNKEIKADEKEKMDAMNDFKILKPKTDAKFEVALAYRDGSYSYKDKSETLDSAMEKVKVLEKDYTDNSIIPCIINSDGQVVYATNSMGRIWNHRNGEPLQGDSVITLLYNKSEYVPNEGKAFTYINQLSVDDVPIIELQEKSAKIQVNGYSGWINKDVNSGNYDLVVVPINQVKNPSCYFVKNGALYHYISTNMTFDGIKGYSVRVGLPPSYLKEGIDYYSYDGLYFYEGQTVQDGLNKLISDLKNGTKENSINPNNPNYNYYEYLPFRTKTNYSAEELDKYINNNTEANSKLRGLGKVLIECQNKYGVNPLLTLGVAIHESDFGRSDIAQTKNNLFGINAVDFAPGETANSFATPEDCVREFTKNEISRGYADPYCSTFFGGYLGNKQLGTNVKYASDPFWGEKIAQHIFNIDYELSNLDLKNLKEYNGYQLGIYTGQNEVKDSSGNLLYKINPTIAGYGGYAGNIVALKFKEQTTEGKYKILPEITSPMYVDDVMVRYHGKYDYSSFANVNSENVKLINTTSSEFIPGYNIEDTNKDEKIDVLDLAEISVQYDNTIDKNEFKKYLDLNSDGIIDVFDIIKASLKISG